MRFFAFSLLVLCGSAAASSLLPSPDDGQSLESQWSPETMRALQRGQDFRAKLHDWKNRLETGSATLRQVVDEVKNYCEVFCPVYLEVIQDTEDTACLDTAIGRNFIRCFRPYHYAEDESPAEFEGIRLRLEQELATWGNVDLAE